MAINNGDDCNWGLYQQFLSPPQSPVLSWAHLALPAIWTITQLTTRPSQLPSSRQSSFIRQCGSGRFGMSWFWTNHYGMDDHYEKYESEGNRHHAIIIITWVLRQWNCIGRTVPYSKTKTISQHSVNVLLSHYAHCKRSQKLIHIARQNSALIRLWIYRRISGNEQRLKWNCEANLFA